MTFFHLALLLWSSLLQWAYSVPLKRADNCPGYTASNVLRSSSSLTADLSLAGTACNIYGQDLQSLKFLAEWQTGKVSFLHNHASHMPTSRLRSGPAPSNLRNVMSWLLCYLLSSHNTCASFANRC